MPVPESGQLDEGIATPRQPDDGAPPATGPFLAPAQAEAMTGVAAVPSTAAAPASDALTDALGAGLALALVACAFLLIRLRAALSELSGLRRERDLARQEAARLEARVERVQASQGREIERRTERLAGENRRLRRERQALEDSRTRLEARVDRDELTGLLLRPAFEAAIDRELRRALRDNASVTVLAWTLDDARLLTQRLGPERTGAALRRLAAALQGACRRGGDHLARIGPDRFAAILPGTGLSGAVRLAGRVRENVHALALPNPLSRADGRLTLSAGIVEPDPATGPEASDVLAALEAACGEAARRGGDQLVKVRMEPALPRRAAG